MRLGPVFQAELLTLARRPRFFVGRTLYGLLVLFIVSSTYRSMLLAFGAENEVRIEVLASVGVAIFSSFATLQGVIVLALTPALVAGAIADERQRKTLHYLMASQLSATEIILGKVGARLLRVGVLGAIGLPVLSLLSLFGGVDPVLVLLVYGATATTTWLLASIAICCSIHAVKPRDAIMRAYFLESLWLAVPTMTLATMGFWSPFWRAIGEPLRPVLEWVAISSPTDLYRSTSLGFSSSSQVMAAVLWMMGMQLVYGACFVLYAVLRLRPTFRGEGSPGWWRRRFRPRAARPQWRLWPRPPCGNDAMLWKEMYLQRVSPLKRVALGLLILAATGLTIYAAWDTLNLAATEVLQMGWSHYGRNQRDINSILRGANAVLIVVILIALGSGAASSVAQEREGDTWTNLTSAPLDGLEVIRAKIIGSVWMVRWLIFILAACWVFGLLIGAIHPVGVLACLIELAVFTWFTAALGVRMSLRAKNTIQALTQTIGLLILLNVGYLVVFLMFRAETMLILVGCMPFHFTGSLIGMDELQAYRGNSAQEAIAAVVIGTILYAAGAAVLTAQAIWAYDAAVDRPDRTRGRRDLSPASLALLQQTATKAATQVEL